MDEKNTKWSADYERAVPVKLDEIVLVNGPKEKVEEEETDMEEERLINIQELAMYVGASIQTISLWYRWKAANPDNERAKLLPEYTQLKSGHGTRLWKITDVESLVEFKATVPKGRYGLMGAFTQKYVAKNLEEDRYIAKTIENLKKNGVAQDYLDVIEGMLREEYENRRITTAA